MSLLPVSDDQSDALPPAHAPTRWTWRNLFRLSYLLAMLAVVAIAVQQVQLKNLSDDRARIRQEQVTQLQEQQRADFAHFEKRIAQVQADEAAQRQAATCTQLGLLQRTASDAANVHLLAAFRHQIRCPGA